MQTERQEEEAEWQAEAADKRRGAGKRAPAGGWAGKSVPRLTALMAGPWAGTRWWRGEGVGAPADGLAATERGTWRRMVQWGEVPDEVHDMLAFAGVSDSGRRRLVGRVSQAQRDASAQAVWHGRARHQAVGGVLWARPEGAEEAEGGSGSEGGGSEGDSEDEDRGQWEGEVRGEGGARRGTGVGVWVLRVLCGLCGLCVGRFKGCGAVSVLIWVCCF